jgi:hypothetical protein
VSKRVFCTIITKSYIAYARTLANTIAEHNPDSELFVLLADKVDRYFDPSLEPFRLIQLEELSDQELIKKMCFYYTPFELCCALRGMLHEYLFDKTSAQSWLFLDSDVMVFHSLDILFKELEEATILLTPHCTTPINKKYVEPHEANLLRSGLYNAGFLGLRRTDEAKKFISWFKERLTSFCFHDYDSYNGGIASRGFFVDQLWLNLVPLYFKNTSLCFNAGANIGHWNLFERTLEKDSLGKNIVNNQPVLFVHFSGWDINNPHLVSKYAPMYKKEIPQLWMELSKIYQEQLFKNGYEETISYPYAFNYFENGRKITSEMRRFYYSELMQNTVFETSPFANYLYFENRCHSNKFIKYHLFSYRFREYIIRNLNELKFRSSPKRDRM